MKNLILIQIFYLMLSMGTDPITQDLINSLEEVVSFYEMNDEGIGEPFVALGFSKDVLDVFQRAKQTQEKAKKELG